MGFGKERIKQTKTWNIIRRGFELFNVPSHLILVQYDFKHSLTEDRIISIGPINRGIVIVISTERD